MNADPTPLRVVALLAAAALLAPACDDEDDGALPGAGPLRLLVASRGPAALELVDVQTLERALDSPLGLDDAPIEARADEDAELFVTSFAPPASARAFDAALFEEEPDSDLGAGSRVAFDSGNGRIFLAGTRLQVFDATTFAPLFPGVDLAGEATDVVHDEGSGRVFVAVSGDRARLQVFAATNLAEVPPSPLELGEAGSRTADLLLVAPRAEVFVALPGDEQLAVVDAATLRQLPRSPIDVRVQATSLVHDPRRERIYAAAADGRLDAVGATDFSLEGGFPRQVAGSISDLAFELETQRIVVADSSAERLVVLDGLTLEEERGSPVRLDGMPVSVEVLDLRD